MKKEWTGLLVGPDEFDPKHPQLEGPRPGSDPQAVRNPRPDVTEVVSAFLLRDKFCYKPTYFYSCRRRKNIKKCSTFFVS